MNLMQFNASQFNKPQVGQHSSPIIANDLSSSELPDGEGVDFELNPLTAVTIEEPEIKIADTVEAGFFKQDTTSDEAKNVIGDPSQSLLSFLTVSQPTIASVPVAESMIARSGIDSAESIQRQLTTAISLPEEEPLTQGQKREQATKSLVVTSPFLAKSLVAIESNGKPVVTQGNVDLAQKVLALASEKPVQFEQPQNLNQSSQQPIPAVEGNDKGINWSPLKLRGAPNEMAKQLQNALRDRLQIQADNRIQQATIRLDPPSLGKIDILVNLDAGKLNIQINSNHADVQRALQQSSSELRQQLVEQNFVQVNVQVSSQNSQQGAGQYRQQRNNEEQIINAEEFTHHDRSERFDDSILTTV